MLIPTSCEGFTPRQTNTALYFQLHQAGCTTNELQEVRDAYRIACRLFNGRYRKTERAFICHVVGVASAAAQFSGDLNLVIAGLLHAAYDSGQFPDGRTGKLTPTHRHWLRDQVGSVVECLVANFASFDFSEGRPEQYVQADCDASEHDCLVLSLVHELDDLADGGLAFAPKYGDSIVSRVEACAVLAQKIGNAPLAECLREQGVAYRDTGWTEGLKSESLRGYRIAPNASAYYRLRRDHVRGKHVQLH